jgi:hypothetical protein
MSKQRYRVSASQLLQGIPLNRVISIGMSCRRGTVVLVRGQLLPTRAMQVVSVKALQYS